MHRSSVVHAMLHGGQLLARNVCRPLTRDQAMRWCNHRILHYIGHLFQMAADVANFICWVSCEPRWWSITITICVNLAATAIVLISLASQRAGRLGITSSESVSCIARRSPVTCLAAARHSTSRNVQRCLAAIMPAQRRSAWLHQRRACCSRDAGVCLPV